MAGNVEAIQLVGAADDLLRSGRIWLPGKRGDGRHQITTLVIGNFAHKTDLDDVLLEQVFAAVTEQEAQSLQCIPPGQ
jgi:hypothetical protein